MQPRASAGWAYWQCSVSPGGCGAPPGLGHTTTPIPGKLSPDSSTRLPETSTPPEASTRGSANFPLPVPAGTLTVSQRLQSGIGRKQCTWFVPRVALPPHLHVNHIFCCMLHSKNRVSKVPSAGPCVNLRVPCPSCLCMDTSRTRNINPSPDSPVSDTF